MSDQLGQLRLLRDHVEVAYLLAGRIPAAQPLTVNLADMVADIDFLLAITEAEQSWTKPAEGI
jgi:hypothetical protein